MTTLDLALTAALVAALGLAARLLFVRSPLGALAIWLVLAKFRARADV